MGIAWALLLPLDAFLKHRVLSAARAARERHPNVTVIGVTGSVGKTTTKELLSCVLRDLEPLTTPVHVNTEMGVAAWMTRVLRNVPTDATTVLIVEMGAYKKGEIALLCSFAQPTMGVVTSVGTQHIALFGSQENLIDAKAELVESLPSSGRAFLNGDNDFARSMKDRVQCPTTIVGTGGRSDLEAFDITETSRGVRFRVNNTNIDVQLPGTHNVTNVLLALAVGEALDIPFPRMAELLRSFTPPSKTFQIREENGVRLLDDTHNGSAASMKAAIAWARNQPETTKVLLTAGLIEMGEYQAPAERDLGTFAAQVFERTVVVNPLSAINFRQGGKNVEILSPQSARVVPGTLLVCSGRMPASVINRLLPKP
jgi:UDP-N-acetylmuramoyl-tripeptide--D-alanyl-D-alanine ligase